jgi:hypothetical protein
MKTLKNICYVIFCVLTLTACSGSKDAKTKESRIYVAHILDNISIDKSTNGIVPLPEQTLPVLRNTFDRYTRISAPNGKPVHFLAQAAWSDDQILKARNTLRFILTDFPGSVYGDNKAKVADAMANSNAAMVLFNDVAALEKAFDNTPLENVDLSMQDLRANECPADGSDDYLNHITRDASFEEIWHLVHDYGIKQTLPEMIAEMRRANKTAIGRGWQAWPEDEPVEHPNEYVGALLDNYFDLWTIRPKKYEGRDISAKDVPEGTSHFGRYFAGSRKKMSKMDPEGFALIEKFFHPSLTYTAKLPEDFKGTFSLTFDKNLVYTYKSRHLKNVTLRGNHNADLVGNESDNKLTGNKGANRLTGAAGSDVLAGGEGEDTAIFSGDYNEYEISKDSGKIRIKDKLKNRDGCDILINIEFLRFRDKLIKL